MPGALTVLSASTTAVCVSEAMEKAAGVYQSPYTIKALFFHQHHAFLQFTNVNTFNLSNKINYTINFRCFQRFTARTILSQIWP